MKIHIVNFFDMSTKCRIHSNPFFLRQYFFFSELSQEDEAAVGKRHLFR